MRYLSGFSDKNGVTYDIIIQSGTNTTEKTLVCGGDPVNINTTSENLFTPIKSRGCTINFVLDDYEFGLYSSTSRNGSVLITDEDDNVIFKGFISPNVYDQTYTNLDSISVECVDCISTCKDYKYTLLNGSTPQFLSFISIILRILQSSLGGRFSGYEGKLYVPLSYTYMNTSTQIDGSVLEHLYVSEANFFDDDDEHTPWKEYEVLEEILKFLGWSLVPYQGDIYLVDYEAISKSASSYHDYKIYNISDGSIYASQSTIIPNYIIGSGGLAYAAGTSSISLDDTYNKITINDNLYKIEEISPDIFKENNHISCTEELIGLNSSRWTTTTTKKHWLRADEVSTDITGYEYQTICRLKPESGWTHKFFLFPSLSQNVTESGRDYYDEGSNSQYTSGRVNKYCNTHGCLLQHYAYVKNDGKNNLPTSLSWKNYLTFFVFNDKATVTINNLKNGTYEKDVLKYTVSEDVMFKPKSGTSWIVIKGDIFYQYDNYKYSDGKSTLHIVNTTDKYYTTAPVDESSDAESGKYLNLYRTYSAYGDSTYGLGFRLWKVQVKIGNKYWTETFNSNTNEYEGSWTTTPSTFYLRYNNNPSNRDDEYLNSFAWNSIVPNTDYTDKVGENAYCIPIRSGNNSDPSFGKLEITFYTPSIISQDFWDLLDEWHTKYGWTFNFNQNVTWDSLPPAIYVKDFSVDYVYTDDSIWYEQKSDTDDEDVIYTGWINVNNVNDFDNLELKINTAQNNKPISRSYVASNSSSIKTLTRRGGSAKDQEFNLIDMYYSHYSTPKKKFTMYINKTVSPIGYFSLTNENGRYMVGSQNYSVSRCNNEINLIEF